MTKREFPFVPKSALKLLPGDFWAIPIQDNLYACGRVIGYWPKDYKGNRTGFLAGLLDWSSDEPPTAESIAGAPTIEQGGSHYKAILLTGGAILGNRPLQLDCISPQYFIEYPDNRTAYLYKGLEPIRPATKEEISRYSSVSIFGLLYMRERASYLFGRNMP